MKEQHHTIARPQPCLTSHLRVVYSVRQFEHCTVDELGEPDQLVQEEMDESTLYSPPYYCRRCRAAFRDWLSAKTHVEAVA